jgi:hypothetical protein
MTEISVLAIDLAKGSFQICAVGPGETVPYNRAMPRPRLASLLADQPSCVVAMGAGRHARRPTIGAGSRRRTATRCGWCRRPT